MASAKANEPAEPTALTKARPVLVWSEYRVVLFGYAEETSGDVIRLARARMAIKWGTSRGIFQLAETGPTPQSRVSARADVDLRKIISVMEVTAAAAAAWESLP